jgi:hypothetical protein
MGKPIYAQPVINEELEWQEVQIQLEKQLVDESSGGVMHSSIHDINHRARRVIDDPEAPDADAKPHWGLHEQALRTKGETTADRLPELMLRTARPQEVYHCRVITEDGSPTTVGLDHSSTDFRWMKVPAELEGFDPMAVNGPTYYRVTRDPECGWKIHYYSTFRKPGGTTVLLITELERE